MRIWGDMELNIYKDKARVLSLVDEVKKNIQKPVRLMEVCGTHTQSFFKYGLKSLLPKELDLVSGPGCPVCVTDDADIDTIWELCKERDIIITTFGDMIKVPGTKGNLSELRAEGADIRVVISPMDAIKIAKENPAKSVVFIAIGFETTIPLIAYSLIFAKNNKVDNFFIYNALKTMPVVLDVLFSDPEIRLDGLICPGHVSSIIGTDAYIPVVNKYKLPCVVAGFEPLDLMLAILMLIKQVNESDARVENAYARVVAKIGNLKALETISAVFKPGDVRWRGMGLIENSGLSLRDDFESFDICKKFDIVLETKDESKKNPCQCGDVLKGKLKPPECKLFRKICEPTNPKGPCMVSSEGSCNTYFRYYSEEV